jgi:hypothetical protein
MASSINASTAGAGGVITTADNSGVLNLQSGGTTVATVSSTGFSTPANQTINTANTFGFKNRIINGGMTIDQRNAGAAISSSGYSVDRFRFVSYGAATAQQTTTVPTGFNYSLKWTTTTGSSPGATSYTASIAQPIEGYNVADLQWGTANAKTITLSFWVYANNTGTYPVSIGNSTTNNGASSTRSYVSTYTVSAANTWQQVTVTIPGDTTGTWNSTTSCGLLVWFDAGSGSDYNTASTNTWLAGAYLKTSGSFSLQGTTSATWYVTGVQLEVGSQATSFDFRDYGRELIMCQRYCFFPATGATYVGGMNGTNSGLCTIPFPVVMRTAPSGTIAGSWTFDNFTSNGTTSAVNLQNSSTTACRIYPNSLSGISGGSNQAFEVGPGNTGTIILSAEL